MKREGGAATPERPRAGECPSGVPGLGLAPWARALGPRGGAEGRRVGVWGMGRAWGAGLRRSGVSPVSPSVCQLVRHSFPFSILSFIHSFFLRLLIAAGCPALW